MNSLATDLDASLFWGVAPAQRRGLLVTYASSVLANFAGHGLCDSGTSWLYWVKLTGVATPWVGSYHLSAAGQPVYEAAFARVVPAQ